MTSYTKDGVTTTYTYYASGLRESKTANGETKKFIWDGEDMVLEYVVTDEYQLIADYKKYYAYGADGLAYRKDSDGSVYTYNTNYRGDVLSVMDDDLNKKAEYLFDAYGNIIKSSITPGFTDNFGYRGEYHDPESGYIYLRNRYLDPATGSFTSEDPIRDGLNWFNYCNGNPIKFTDPWGLEVGIKENELMNYLTPITDDELAITEYNKKYEAFMIDIKVRNNGNKPVGTNLLRDLIDSENVCIIQFTSGNTDTKASKYYYKETNTTGADIFFNPNYENKYLTEARDELTGEIYSVESVMPNMIKMAHELIHAYHRFTIPFSQMLNARTKYGYYTYPSKNPGGRINIGMDPIEEIETVGYSYMATMSDFFHRTNVFRGGEATKYTENQIRAEHGLPMVVAYSERLLRKD